MKKTLIVTAVILGLFMMAGCVPGPNLQAGTPGEDGTVAGFWHGLWHGFIILFTFIGSLFYEGVHVYEVHNNGILYDLGLLLGIITFFGGGGGATRRSRRR